MLKVENGLILISSAEWLRDTEILVCDLSRRMHLLQKTASSGTEGHEGLIENYLVIVPLSRSCREQSRRCFLFYHYPAGNKTETRDADV